MQENKNTSDKGRIRIYDVRREDTNTIQPSVEDKKKCFAEKLKQQLNTLNLSKKEIGYKLGKKSPEISKFLKGDHNFTLETVFEIEEKLGISLIPLNMSRIVKDGKIQFKIAVSFLSDIQVPIVGSQKNFKHLSKSAVQSIVGKIRVHL